MFVSLKDVINLPEFADVEILAGKNGLYRNVTSISINDLRKGIRNSRLYIDRRFVYYILASVCQGL